MTTEVKSTAKISGPIPAAATHRRRLHAMPVREYLAAMKKSVVSLDPEVMSGTPVFRGTRVPVQTLLDHLEGGESIDDFLEGFPSVSRKQAIAFLEEAKDLLIE